VALKLPCRQRLGENLVFRFQRERDILAKLTHAHIARFYDAGIAPDGQPYIALEVVDGEPVTIWADRNGLGLEARLGLIEQMADALGAAHALLVAHGDIKPGNVLVTCDGSVRLLDFGIAELLRDEELFVPSFHTVLPPAFARVSEGERPWLGRAWTPGYAAPELVRGHPASVASDVYALGVLMHELLSGLRPRMENPESTRTGGCPSLSDALQPRHAQAMAEAHDRLQARYQGDLDAIVAKATHADAGLRYASMAAFSGDIRRYRGHWPVVARPLSAWGRGVKFVRRHRMGVGLSAALGLVLWAGGAGVAWQMRVAQKEAARADAIQRYLMDIFVGASPRTANEKPASQITVKELLDRKVGRIVNDLPEDIDTANALLLAASNIYVYLGEGARSAQLEQIRVDLLKRQLGDSHPTVLDAQLALVWSYQSAEMFQDARVVLDALRNVLDEPAPPGRAWAEWWLAWHDQLAAGQAPAAERLAALRTALNLYRSTNPGDSGHAAVLFNLGEWMLGQGEAQEALAYFDMGLELLPSLQPQIVTDQARLLDGKARAWAALGDTDRALQDSARSVDLWRSSVGLHVPTSWGAVGRRATWLCQPSVPEIAPEQRAALKGEARALLAQLPVSLDIRRSDMAELVQAARVCAHGTARH
jgi:serine/threonine-protein kinase